MTVWPDIGAFAVKTVEILPKVAKFLSASRVPDTKRENAMPITRSGYTHSQRALGHGS